MNDQKMSEMEECPKFGGNPGEPVPLVDPEDIEAVWRIAREGESNKTKATGFEIFKRACNPEADVQAVFYRSSLIWLISRCAPEQMARFTQDGKPTDAVFRAIAKVPAEWMRVGIVREGPPLDMDEFLRLCDAETKAS